SDHSPASPDVKELESGNLSAAWGGIAGLQFLLTASFSALKDSLKIEKFIPLLTENPAKFLGLQKKGFLKAGYDADIVIWDDNSHTLVTIDKIFHRHNCCPYTGKKLLGKVLSTIVNGEVIFENDNFIKRNTGKWLM
ncbi:MAG: amidohydrolase family protein, partial [Ferruginibacter sp.]